MDATIYGESAHSILRTLAKSDRRITASGMHQFDLRMAPTEVGPVVRSLMRAEAELLIQDAETFDPHEECRTPEQRRADALVEVVTAAAAALKIRHPTPALQRTDARSATRSADPRWLD